MTKDTFAAGMALLEEAFNRKFSRQVYWKFLRRLPDESFAKAVEEIIREIPELYPNTNLIAIIQAREVEIRKTLELAERDRRPRIEDKREPAPPPPEWRKMMKKLKGKYGI